MNRPAPTDARAAAPRLREARRQWLDTGDVADGLIDAGLRQSWRRSQAYGLAPAGRMPGAPHASSAQLARALEHQRELVAHARPLMAYLFEQTCESGSLVILSDAQGLLLQTLGEARFLERAQRVALRPGANWHEQWRGTNAIGTALAEVSPVVVHGGEHYLERNGFLTCTAAPILDSCGRVLGVIDISGDHRDPHRHTLALVRSAARMIEHRLFDTRHAGSVRLRLHAQPEGVGTVAEGRLALSDEGHIMGADAAALGMLGLTRGPGGMLPPIDRSLQVDMDALCGWAQSASGAPHPLRRPDGSVLWARVEAGRSVLTMALRAPAVCTVPARPAPAAADALAALDTGDPAMHTVLARARRVLDKPIALLLQGETGTGKEVFARALHGSSARRAGPFVAVNCAALPEGLIEAELFGYRPGAYTGAGREGAPGRLREAHGGTLFLDEIGDMPLSLQARLLRVLQDRQVVPLGGGTPVPVDFRLVCATHRQLRTEIEAGRFREDLYYRLNGLLLPLPSLRERHDLHALVVRLLAELEPSGPPGVAADLMNALAGYRWPGNLRQLRNVLQTACALRDPADTELSWAHLPEDLAAELHGDEPVARAVFDDVADLRLQSERTIRETVAACQGNLSQAARRLGISRNTLYRRLGGMGLR